MLSISLNDPSPIYPPYTHTKIVPPTIQTTTHLHATPDLTKIMFSIFLMSLPPWILHTHPHSSTHRIRIYPITPTVIHSPVYYGYPVGGCGSVRSRLVPVAKSTCRVAFGSPTRASATGTSPDTDTAKTTQQDCSCLPNNIALAPGMHSMVLSWGCQHLPTGCWNIAQAGNRIVVFSP